MSVKRMLIDTMQEEETRVVIMNDDMIELVEYDNERHKQTKGNIYLGRISRIEPSLQAVFVEYGANRHGFLSFSEVHSDYYLLSDQERERLNELILENYSGELDDEGNPLTKKPIHPSSVYDIYHALKPNQPLIVQVVKEERGNKGAALTTIISISGRYCVFMPNTHNNSGVSRKITNTQDRQRIREILESLELPFGVSTIIRTAGEERSKQEIVRDMKYLIKLWETICIDAKATKQIGLIYEEANLIRRAIRDIYTRDIDEILVEGNKGFEQAKNFMKVITPSHSKKIIEYTDESLPLFSRYQVERHLSAIANPIVQLPSGGSIVISPTEALVAIDVNSGKATRANSVEETAYHTNLEATDEIMKQLQLKNLAGLIVIDFIDMLNPNNQKLIEQRVKKLLKDDNAKIQVSKLSRFGLLELSRQRLRPSIFETNSITCPHCGGTGYMRSNSSSALNIIRAIEEEAIRGISSETITVLASKDVVLYILNEKSSYIVNLENKFKIKINFDIDLTKQIDEYTFKHAEDSDLEMVNSHYDSDYNNKNLQNVKSFKEKNFKYQAQKYQTENSYYSKVPQQKNTMRKYSNDTYGSYKDPYKDQHTNLRQGRKKSSYDSDDNNDNKVNNNSYFRKNTNSKFNNHREGMREDTRDGIRDHKNVNIYDKVGSHGSPSMRKSSSTTSTTNFARKNSLSVSEKRRMSEILGSEVVGKPKPIHINPDTFEKKDSISLSEKRKLEEILGVDAGTDENSAETENTTFSNGGFSNGNSFSTNTDSALTENILAEDTSEEKDTILTDDSANNDDTSLNYDSLNINSVNYDSLNYDSLNYDSLKTDSTNNDTLNTDSPPTDTEHNTEHNNEEISLKTSARPTKIKSSKNTDSTEETSTEDHSITSTERKPRQRPMGRISPKQSDDNLHTSDISPSEQVKLSRPKKITTSHISKEEE